MQYSQDLKEYLPVEKQITVACADEASISAMQADPNILDEHLTIEASIDTSRMNAATRLAAINENSWSFLEGTAGAFDKDYDVFSQLARSYLRSRAGILVSGQDQATHLYDGCTYGVEASPSSKLKEPIIFDISHDEENLVFISFIIRAKG
ncbi:hypothetical protein D1007_25409 [Hordeum vulgare]|nr:hypothetical protein D1007_25409 [Hordeum vulgare]